MSVSLHGQVPGRIVVDTNIIWSGALSPGSNAARLVELKDRTTFYVPHQVEVELWRHIGAIGRDDLHRAGVSALVDRYLAEIGAVRLSELSASSSVATGDSRIIAVASQLGAAVCTYNLKDFASDVAAVTPVYLLRSANLTNFFVEEPEGNDVGTFLYLIRIWNENHLGMLLEFRDGTAIVGTAGRKIEVRSRAGDQSQSELCKEPLPNGQRHGLVIRFVSTGKLHIDIWHPSGSNRQLNGRPTGSSGDRPLWRQSGQSNGLVLNRFWRPKWCECFGISTVPKWLDTKSIAHGVVAETLEASMRSEDVRELIGNVSVADPFGEFAFVSVLGSDQRTKFLPASSWSDHRRTWS